MRPTEDDEFVHTPEDDPDWQENLYFSGLAPGHRAAFEVHVAHFPHRGYVHVAATVGLGGRLVSHIVERPAANFVSVPRLDVEAIEPLRKLRLRYSGQGYDGSPMVQGEGLVPFGMDLKMSSPVAPLTTDDQNAEFSWADGRYELGADWTGTLWCGSNRVAAQGLGVRDHSWGVRSVVVDAYWWLPMYFPDPPTFISGLTVLQGGRWRGTCAVSDSDGVRQSGEPWVRPDGIPLPGAYRSATVVHHPPSERDPAFLTEAYRVAMRLPHMTRSDEDFILYDMLSTARCGTQKGYCHFQFGAPEGSPLLTAFLPQFRPEEEGMST
ncbi:hypothetical protein [Actinomadura rubrisoli]|uniref:AttH domain-containing protein n=1 Tax=Actinomadura rubrisoli TaxID=2530368 RepID=A0A4R5BKV6_9ACTN|nr:hypothetical protein [Actinomadura rubrisoli]TDD84484.1 hypothetical protein E1298_19900 [Actinomadura rubrisoli]